MQYSLQRTTRRDTPDSYSREE